MFLKIKKECVIVKDLFKTSGLGNKKLESVAVLCCAVEGPEIQERRRGFKERRFPPLDTRSQGQQPK